ncbi:MAG: helix-turn-helix transcriptional regulator [Paracoccaceae bacterium]
MAPPEPHRDRQVGFLGLLVLVQALCAVFFITDFFADMRAAGGGFSHLDFGLVMELVASVAISGAIPVEIRVMIGMVRKQRALQRSMRIATGALSDLIEEYFTGWGLTPAESDVARFTIKGFSIAEIAELRGAREGTIKTQLNAIYRKSGVAGRGQLVSLLIEDLMAQPLIDEADHKSRVGLRQEPAE